ncbi:hypothetical protein EST38_g12622 [Candolleomyces aberdarensis]|uniref:USP8 dimerisation domain-containing protein n=1 Tax=Candolleomyces aberdarensis TaxID=2316362 RepID=A0A4Q2D1Y6_9AGAR|nr:hypothetical protein EST38_g12622 [Candolleomyces aberdarensis]
MPADGSKYYHGRPASMDELVELIRHSLWRERRSVRYWLKKIQEYRDMAWDAAREEDKEFAYVYAFKAAVLIFDKMPKLEDFRELLDLQRKKDLAEHGHQLIELINRLTPQLRQEHDEWIQEERTRVEAVEAVRQAKVPSEATPSAPNEVSQGTYESMELRRSIDTSFLFCSISIKDSQDPPAKSPPSPSGLAPEAYGDSTQLEPEIEKKRRMRLLAAEISRPGIPVSHDTPLPPELLNGPPPSSPTAASQPDLKNNGYGEDLNDGDYGESRWASGRGSHDTLLPSELFNGPPPPSPIADSRPDLHLKDDRDGYGEDLRNEEYAVGE